MDQQHLCRVRLAVGAQTAIQGCVDNPLTEVGLRHATAKDALTLNGKTKGYVVEIVSIGNDDGLAQTDIVGIGKALKSCITCFHIAKIMFYLKIESNKTLFLFTFAPNVFTTPLIVIEYSYQH